MPRTWKSSLLNLAIVIALLLQTTAPAVAYHVADSRRDGGTEAVPRDAGPSRTVSNPTRHAGLDTQDTDRSPLLERWRDSEKTSLTPPQPAPHFARTDGRQRRGAAAGAPQVSIPQSSLMAADVASAGEHGSATHGEVNRTADALSVVADLPLAETGPVGRREVAHQSASDLAPTKDDPRTLAPEPGSVQERAAAIELPVAEAEQGDVASKAMEAAAAAPLAAPWANGNVVSLNCDTRIYEGPGYSYPWHTESPHDGYQVLVIGDSVLVAGETWWPTSRRALSGDPRDGTGWVSQLDAETSSCPDGGPPPLVWAVDTTVGVCAGTGIWQGPDIALHTIVDEDNWNVYVTEGPVYSGGRTWWNTSRFLAGDPSGGTGWISEEQAGEACATEQLTGFYGPGGLDAATRAVLREHGINIWQHMVGDPVNEATGNFVQQATDIHIPGVAGFDLVISRTYNSLDERAGVFGYGWSSLLDTRLRIANDGTIDVRYPDGHGSFFVLNGDEYEAGQDGVFDTLVYVDRGFELTTVDQMVYRYDEQGYLTEYRDRHGNVISLDRDGDHHITLITDSAGREFPVTYDGEHIASISDPIDRDILYEYDNDDLVAVTDGNGGVDRYAYEDHLLTMLTDPEGIVYLKNIYDGDGRVIEQIDAGGTHSFVDYGGGSGITTVTDNLSNDTLYYHDALRRVVQVEDALGNSEFFAYDDDYNVVSYQDKNGGVWSYTYDDRGNMLSETDPLTNETTHTYNATNDLTSTTDALGRTTTYTVNGAGDVTLVTHPDGTTEAATYDIAGQMLTFTDANTHTTNYVYDSEGNQTKVIDPIPNETHYGYDAVGRRTSITDANGHLARFEYDGNDNLVEITDPKTRVASFTYDLNDSLIQMEDRRGAVTRYVYDDNLKLIAETDPEQHTTRHDYDLMYNRISTTDPRGNVTAFTYDEIYRLTNVEDALHGHTGFGHDANGNVKIITDTLEFVTRFDYDELDRLTVRTDALSGETRFVYDEVGQLVSTTNPRLATTEYEYDERDRLILVRDALDGQWRTGYDPAGNVTSIVDANDIEVRFEYDDADRLIRQIDGEGHVTSYGYDGVGNRTSVTDGRGNVTQMTYDKNDNLHTIKDALDGVTELHYDEEDNLILQVDPSGHETEFTYNLDGLLTRVLDAEGHTTTYQYDAAHNLEVFTNANDNAWVYTYDELNRRTSQTDPLEGVVRYEYDLLGQQIRVTDENEVVTRFDFDALGRVEREVRNEVTGQPADQATNVTFEFRYDAVGNRIVEVDAEGNETEHVYDLLDRLKKRTDAEDQVTRYGYDPVGNLIEFVNPRGFSTTFDYDRDNLLTSVTDPLLQVWQFEYDEVHNRTTVTDPHLIVTRSEYDALNRLQSETKNFRPGETPDSEINVTTSYEYYRDSTLRSMTDPNGNTTHYSYDGLHRQVEVKDAQDGLTRFTYDGVGNLRTTTDANDHTTTDIYDELNRRTSTIDPANHVTVTGYDPVGNVIRETNARNFTTRIAYDPLRRAIEITDAKDGVVALTYDAMGNIVGIVDQNDHPQSFAYDHVYRVLSHKDAEDHITAFAYDKNGNRVSLTDGNSHVTTFTYDELDRLASMTNAESETTRFDYDALGNRTGMTENDGVVTRYDFDPIYRLTAVTLNHVDGAVADHETNVLYDYHYDANGNLTAITDPLAHRTFFAYDSLNRMVRETNPLNDIWQYSYDPVGNLLDRLDANGDLTRYAYTDDDLLERISYPDASVVTYGYDANHNRTTMSDQLGTATWTYDELDRMTAASDSFGRLLSYEYDPVGNRTAITYPDDSTVAYGYFDNDWLATVTDPEGGLTSYTRDGVGQVTLTVNPNDTVAEMAYDKANRLLSLANRQTVGAKKTISAFEYSLDDVGQRTHMTAEYGWRNPPVVDTDYGYDSLRRLVRTEESAKHGDTVWADYTFDAAGNRLELSTNDDVFSPRPFDAKTQVYTYNDANQVLSIVNDLQGVSGKKQKRPEKTAQALHALRHQIAAQRGKHISELAADDLLAQVDDLIADLYSSHPPTRSDVADALDDLIAAVAGYRVTGDIDNDGTASSLTKKLEKASAANEGGSGAPGDLQTETFTYDGNGNRVSHEFPGPQGPKVQGTDYSYDYENRMLEALDYQGNSRGHRVDRAVTRMDYDGIGRRLNMTYDPSNGAGGANSTNYLFDGLDPVAEYDLWNGHRRNFYRGDRNRMVSMQSFPSSQMLWYAYDGLGSVTGLTKNMGQSVHNYRYDVYGTVKPVNGNWTAPHNSYTFTGQEWVESLGMLHFYAREYDPGVGVWVQQDVYRGRLAEPVTLHRYGYVGANPTGYVDLFGYLRCAANGSGPEDYIACYDAGQYFDIPADNEPINAVEFDALLEANYDNLQVKKALPWIFPDSRTDLAFYFDNDTPFYDYGRDDSIVCLGSDQCARRSEVNYYHTGMLAAADGMSREAAHEMVEVYKDAFYSHPPSPKTKDWTDNGYDAYVAMHENNGNPCEIRSGTLTPARRANIQRAGQLYRSLKWLRDFLR